MDETTKKKRITNDDVGRAHALANVQALALARDMAAWNRCRLLALGALRRTPLKAPTLRQYAAVLIEEGYEPPREAWGEVAVGRILKKFGKFTAKSMFQHMLQHTDRMRFRTVAEWPHELSLQWLAWKINSSELSDENGQWVSALIEAPRTGNEVRFLDEAGQLVAPHLEVRGPYCHAPVSNGGRFMAEPKPGAASVEVESERQIPLGLITWPMSRLLVWRWHLSTEARRAREKAKWADIFRLNSRIK